MPTINLDEATKELKKAIDAMADAENDDAEIKLKLQEVIVYGQHRLGEFAADSSEEPEEDLDDELDDEDEDEDDECDDCGEYLDDCVCGDDDDDAEEEDEED